MRVPGTWGSVTCERGSVRKTTLRAPCALVAGRAAMGVSLLLQKRLASSVLKCGKRKIWLDPNEVNEISMANSRARRHPPRRHVLAAWRLCTHTAHAAAGRLLLRPAPERGVA